ncbi:HlyC/CorC family transporter [Schaalia sp. 19OD2882]|uniref:hemolysin family protein n=1 Tax=Schaalia sp. 19OD2882 TaxID=2794089 RepID=UPI001C1E99F0|nr:hemolysin family protein [Schaalia sp. 19OD2882]QWW20630.1 HlyC/CorC family transporter [Schaalia sp. 19OD2882]
MLDLLMILLGVALTVGTFLFVSAEFSLVALDQAVVERRAAEGDRSAEQVLRATRSLSTQLSGSQVGITLTTILLGWTTQRTVADMSARALDSVGLTSAVSTTVGVVVAALAVNALSMLFGELVPKNLALSHPMRTAALVVPFQMAFTSVFGPLVRLLNAVSNWILARMGIEPQEEISAARSASELAALVRHSAQEGTLDTSTAALLTKSIRVGELSAVDVMTDRGLVHFLPEDATAQDVVDRARETGHSRFPVIGEDSDDVLGIVSLRRAIGVPFERRTEVPVVSQSLLAPAPRVPETLELGPLMVQLRDGGVQMAVVLDEYGGVSGIVTLEDVVEEIVGEVSDEHDHRRLGIRTRSDGVLLVPGTLRPDELLERAGVALPDDGPWDTVAGLVMTQLGRVPVVGDVTEVAGSVLEVTQVQGRRVTQIALTPPPERDGEAIDPLGRGEPEEGAR